MSSPTDGAIERQYRLAIQWVFVFLIGLLFAGFVMWIQQSSQPTQVEYHNGVLCDGFTGQEYQSCLTVYRSSQ